MSNETEKERPKFMRNKKKNQQQAKQNWNTWIRWEQWAGAQTTC